MLASQIGGVLAGALAHTMILTARFFVLTVSACSVGASRHVGVRPPHAPPCSDEDITAIVAARPIANSNCPDTSRWVQHVVDQESRFFFRQGAADVINIVSVGCNKGDDLVRQMQMWTKSKVYDVASFRNATQAYGMESVRACPSEPYAADKAEHETSSHSVARVFGYCIEPMPSTFVAVKKAIDAVGLASHVRAFRYAVSSKPGLTWFAGDVPAGVENLGMETDSDSGDGKIATDVVTIDQFATAHRLREIHTLSVDTEGNDARVLIGAIESLPRVRLLEFEYHSVGHWATADLHDTVDYLDNLGFTCFWAGNAGQLWRLTNCWHDSYYADRWWSNVVCCNRRIGSLCKAMENAS